MTSEVRAADQPAGATPTEARRVTVGLDMPPAGRALRALFAAVAVWYRVDRDARFDGAYFLRTVLCCVLVAVVYVVAYRLLSGVLDRMSPWTGTAMFLVPTLIYPMGIGPSSLHDGLGLYTLLGFVLCPALGYAGAEVTALPALVTGRRHRLYTPFNIADRAELAFRTSPGGGWRVWWVVSAVVTGAYFLVFWVVELMSFIRPVEDAVGEFEVPAWLALVLVLPVVCLAVRALRAAPGPERRTWNLAALFLLCAIPVGVNVPDMLWGGIILVGLVTAVSRGVRRLRRRTPATG
ncbi:DUF6410 domain-containing protein [Streptomyces sp. ADMS]|uniref:DUF6410 domain-containing protein n=1 Tax=Streptomyces sp. ADMS TaxID=3071415 RepID=UPI00296E8C38|nr:DUF6410 domain-containing protein [Streptomyces sp. ADMS]MDW4905916.1 DUF6410 domain-containing protein [Streptomyces sp. ADMS]